MTSAGRPREGDPRDPQSRLDQPRATDRRDGSAEPDEQVRWARPGELKDFLEFELPGDGEVDVEEAFGDHDIEYWVWHDNRLIPASPDRVARIRELEALRRLNQWHAAQERDRRRSRRFAWIGEYLLPALARARAGALRTSGRMARRAGDRIPVSGGQADTKRGGPASG